MAKLIIQIPDELAQRLEHLRNRLLELLSQLLDSTDSSSSSLAILTANLQEITQVYLEVLGSLMARPIPQDFVTFKVSPEAQERLRSLLDKNQEGTLAESEITELGVYEQLEHVMILIKARAIASVNQ